MSTRFVLSATVATATLAATTLTLESAAHAADTRLGVFATAGLGGEAQAELDLPNAPDPDEDAQDLNSTLGVGLSYEADLMPVLALGGLFRVYSWSAEPFAWESQGNNEGLGFDLDLFPRVHLPVGVVELYLSVPFGLSLSTKDENTTFLLVDSQYDVGVGWNFGLFGGVEFPLTPRIALFGELGWLMRGVGHRGEAEANTDADAELVYRTGQLTFNLGVAFF